MEINGGCLCGAVRYTAEADPTSATVCHCRDCQKFTGSAFAALVRVPKEAVTIERQRQSDPQALLPRMRLIDRRRVGNATRYRCSECRDV